MDCKIVREPPGCTGNEPTADVSIGSSGQGIKNKGQIHVIEINMLIMYHVHHISTEMEGKNPTKVPRNMPKNTNQTSLKF